MNTPNKLVTHILRDNLIKVRSNKGKLTNAGKDQIYWCRKLIEEMGNGDSCEISNMYIGKKTFTREQVANHIKSIGIDN